MDRTDLLDRLLALLAEHGIRYCVVGGQGVNAYVEPVVRLDLDMVVAVTQLEQLEALLPQDFRVERLAHSLNISLPGSDVRVQIKTDARYAPFVERAAPRDVLGLTMPVAHVEDVLRGKVWAAQDATRRASKRQKDLVDIARLLEFRPELRDQVPQAILSRLV